MSEPLSDLAQRVIERAEYWERESVEACASADSYVRVNRDAEIDLRRSAVHARSRARELRSLLEGAATV